MLHIAHLSKRYPNGTLAIDDVSFSAQTGRVTAILGPNGSGKSTLFKCVARLTDPTSGSIVLAGNDLTTLAGPQLRLARRKMGVVFQNNNLVGRRSSIANVACGCLGRNASLRTACGLLPKDELERAASYLQRVGMLPVAHQRVDTLSGGQAQRVAIARALCQDAVILFADEPVASLDPDAANEVMALLAGLAHDEGLAIVVVLHQLDLARNYADRIVGLRAGRVVIDAETAEVDLTFLAALYQADAA